MSTSTAVSVDLTKTTDCVSIITRFTMGIGRMRQISAKTIKPSEAEGLVREAFIDEPTMVTTAKASELRHQKRLIDSPELDEIRSQDGFIQRHLESRSCRYGEAQRFLPKSEVPQMIRALEAYRTIRRPTLVEKFMAVYREYEAVDFAPMQEALGDQFDRSDYPASDTVEAGFSFTYNMREIGDVNLSGLPDFIIQQEVEKEKQQRALAVAEWRDTMRVLGVKAVDALCEALKPSIDGKKRVLRDANVVNLMEYLSTYDTRDLAGDSEYQQTVVEPLRAIMKGVSAEKIRHSENLKAYIATKVGEVRKNATLLVQATGRKFR